MRLEPRAASRTVLAFPLIAGAMVGACQSGAAPGNETAAAPAAPVPVTPTDIAHRLVLQRLGVQDVAFAGERIFNNDGATIVCGQVSRPSQQPERYIAVGEEDVFVESQMEAGHMDQAFAEFCRNA